MVRSSSLRAGEGSSPVSVRRRWRRSWPTRRRVGRSTGGVEGTHQDQHGCFRQRVSRDKGGGDLDGLVGRTGVDGGDGVGPLDTFAERLKGDGQRRQRADVVKFGERHTSPQRSSFGQQSAGVGRIGARGRRQEPASSGDVGAASRGVEAQPVGAAQPLEQHGGRPQVAAKP